jgi:putative nucleotidyltransferase with HDIG domain
MANWRPQAPAGPLDLDRAILGAVARGGLPIPPYPAVSMRIQEVVSRKEFGLDEVSRIVSADPALAADVLRCANSAMFSRGAPVASLAQAITRIGAQEVTRIAFSSGLAAHAQTPGSLGALKRTVWIESVASAVVCQELARQRGLRPEEAFVLGLLHDFGKVVATSCLEALLEKHPTSEPRPIDEWGALVERHHVAVGLAVAKTWGLPTLVSDVIAQHHADAPKAAEDEKLLEVVRLSDRVAALLPGTVADAEVAAIPSLGPGERELVVRVIETIPSFVAAFEAPAPRGPAPRSMVAAPLTTLAPGQRSVTFGVTVKAERRQRTYVAAAMATNGLVALGSEPLPENQLLEVALQCQPTPFQIWATAKLCRPEGGGVRVEMQPYALGGSARKLWNELYMTARSA